MKPHLLMLLLLAIPPLISTLLASENAEKSDAPPAAVPSEASAKAGANNYSAPKDSPATPATPTPATVTPLTIPAAAAPSAKPSPSRSGTSAGFKAWYLMW